MSPLRVIGSVFVALACSLAGCSSAPDEGPTGSSTSDLSLPRCAANQVISCTGETSPPSCGCVPAQCAPAIPPTLPPLPSEDSTLFVGGYAMVTRNNLCPNLPGSGGVWKQIGPYGGQGAWGGVPTDNTAYRPDCSTVFAGKVSGSTCCTYVWWPNGWTIGEQGYPGDWPEQDPSAVCASTTVEYEEIVGVFEPCVDPDCHGAIGCADCRGP
jgi:hypothetical protein